MKRTGYRESNQPKPIPKFTATRNGKPINPTVGNVDAETVLAQPEPTLNFTLNWLENWPKKPPTWHQVTDSLYKLTLDGTRMEVFSKAKDHSNKPIWGFTIMGQWGPAHSVPTLSFSLKETQQAAIDSLDWINKNKQGNPPYTIDPNLISQEEPAPRPIRNPPPRPMPPIRPDGRGTAPGPWMPNPGDVRILPAVMPNEYFQHFVPDEDVDPDYNGEEDVIDDDTPPDDYEDDDGDA